MHLSLRFLGPLEAQLDSETVAESRAKKIEAMLAFLAAEADHAQRRERLVGLLFPDLPEEQARTNLRQTLTRLRRAIGDQAADPPFLLITRESTQFNLASNHDLDLTAFEQLLGGCSLHHPERELGCEACIENLAQAVSLYRGPFLEGFFLEDSAEFEGWVLVKREQYQAEMLLALQQLATCYERRGAYAQAADYVRRQLVIEPWQEEAHQTLMRLLAYQGKRAAALQQYRVLESTLREELGVAPLPETSALRDRIRAAEETRPARLPQHGSSFVGREPELALLHEHLNAPQRRLVTVTGPGGSGKTALAVETGWHVASQFLGPFYHGVFFVPLAGIGAKLSNLETSASVFDPLVTAVAEAIDFSFSGPREPREQLLRYLQDKSMLLIFDNVEDVIDPTRTLLIAILKRAQNIQFLVTSRERLGLIEEWVLELDGLPYPSNGELESVGGSPLAGLEELSARYEAIALFENLGKRLAPGFGLTDSGERNQGDCPVSAVQRITQLVQGLPLGIELAASWLRILNCAEIATEIENSLDFLNSTMHDLPQRHRSLRAVFNSSWQLLNEEEQQALCRLSVFHGPFTRQAATAVTGASVQTLGALVDRSLLRRLERPQVESGAVRYEILEVLRQYAAEKLAAEPAEAEEMRRRHARYYLDFLQANLAVLQGSEQHAALAAISNNIKEIRAAWQNAFERQDVDGLTESMKALGLFYYMRSWFTEGADVFRRAAQAFEPLRADPHANTLWAKLCARQGWFSFLLGQQHEGRALLEQSIAVLREAGAPADLAFSLSFTAAVLTRFGDYEGAKQLAEESLALTKEYSDAYGSAIANNVLSQICYQLGDFASAKAHSEQSLATERAIGNRWSLGFSLTNLGRVALESGNHEEAYSLFRESLAIRRDLGDRRGQALCLRYLGDAALATGQAQLALQEFEASLALFRSIGSQDETSATLEQLGYLALERQDHGAARRYYAEALQIALEADSMPRVLEAMVGLATLLCDDDLQEAARIAVTVQVHPAASQQSRQHAAQLLAQLRETNPQGLSSANPVGYEVGNLETLVDSLLSRFA